jgi:ATP-dependent Lhr-like helicase
MATNMNDLVECCATARLARRRRLDTLRLPAEPLDVLAQHLVSMGCTARWTRAGALALVRRAWLYRGLSEASFNDVLDYLAGGGKSLRQQYTEVFGKIVLDDEGFETRPGSVRRDFLQNAGTIPNEGVVRVRLKFQTLGSVEESFARNLRPGDVFMIAGRAVRVERHGFMELFVARADHAAPTVPRWNANKMPLSNRVAEEIRAFRGEIRARFAAGDPRDAAHVRWLAERLECGLNNAAIIARMYQAQHELSEIPAADFVLVEELLTSGEDGAAAGEARPRRTLPLRGRTALRGLDAAGELRSTVRAAGAARHYFFHCLVGRAANDALSRVVALRLNRLRGGNAVATPDDYGFVLTVSRAQAVTEDELAAILAPEGFAAELDESLNRAELLKYHFRNAAQTGLMVYRNFFGEQKSAKKLQWSAEVIFNVLSQHEPDHVLLREARRDALNTFLDAAGAEAFLRAAAGLPKRLRRVPVVPPLSFAMYATKIREALMVEDPQETMERLYHQWWEQCTGPERAVPAAALEQMELPG